MKKVISKPEMKIIKLKKYFVATKNINKGDIITANSFATKSTVVKEFQQQIITNF